MANDNCADDLKRIMDRLRKNGVNLPDVAAMERADKIAERNREAWAEMMERRIHEEEEEERRRDNGQFGVGA